MKILVISNYQDYHTARPEANIFKEMFKLGINITIMTHGESQHAKEFMKLGIDVIDFHPQKKFDKKEIEIIQETVIRKKIDIIHAFSNKGCYAAVRAKKGLNVKLILYRGTAANMEWWNPFSYLKHLNPRVDAIMCNSWGVEQYFKKQLFFDKKKAITINKGHNINWYSDIKPINIKKQLELSKKAFLVIKVANNRKVKGIPYLIESLTHISPLKDIHLILVGKNMDNKENLKIISKNNLDKKVHILGFRKDVLNIVASCDVFALSSIGEESLTKSVIEAMALGKPAIITNISGNKELLIDGISGIITPIKNSNKIANAIETLYDNPELITKMGIAAKSRIENELNAKQTVSKLKILYETLITR